MKSESPLQQNTVFVLKSEISEDKKKHECDSKIYIWEIVIKKLYKRYETRDVTYIAVS